MIDVWIPVLIAVLSSGGLSALITFLLTRRKMNAEIGTIKANETDTMAEAIEKFLRGLDSLQRRNGELYNQVVSLEKALNDSEKSKQALINRINDRDGQIKTLSEQLAAFKVSDKQAEISHALVQQQQTIALIGEFYKQLIDGRDRIAALEKRTGPLSPLEEE